MLGTQRFLSPLVLLLPVYLLFLGMFAVGIAWIVAALQVYLRDTSQVVAVAMTFWMWVTPLFFDEKRYEAVGVGFVVKGNPLAYLVRGYRGMLLGSQVVSLRDLGILATVGISTFVLGGLFFRRMKRGFADVL